ncbi:MAG: KH domain-containing protein [Solirubrobacteraceae bacterium]
MILLELAVAQGDYGKVIGRSGRTVHALRTVLSAAGRAADRRERVLIDIVE